MTHNNIIIKSRLTLNISALIPSASKTFPEVLQILDGNSIFIKLAKTMLFKDSDSANSMKSNSYLRIINIIIKSK